MNERAGRSETARCGCRVLPWRRTRRPHSSDGESTWNQQSLLDRSTKATIGPGTADLTSPWHRGSQDVPQSSSFSLPTSWRARNEEEARRGGPRRAQVCGYANIFRPPMPGRFVRGRGRPACHGARKRRWGRREGEGGNTRSDGLEKQQREPEPRGAQDQPSAAKAGVADQQARSRVGEVAHPHAYRRRT